MEIDWAKGSAFEDGCKFERIRSEWIWSSWVIVGDAIGGSDSKENKKSINGSRPKVNGFSC